jgi:hypothetical protein
MRRTGLLRLPSRRMMLALFAALMTFIVAALLMLTQVPAASAQAYAADKEVPSADKEVPATAKELPATGKERPATGKEVAASDLTTSELQAEESRLGDASFSVMCGFSHRNNDDPIVYPGKQGAAHSHDFLGNRSTKYNSTYTTLRSATTSTDPDGTSCNRSEDKSAYWVPTLKWSNQDLKPSIGIIYYRAGNKDHTKVQPFPAGLKVVTAPNKNVTWKCEGGSYSSTPPTQCSNGQLSVRVIFPDCSNGKVDSADHRSHLTHSRLQSNGIRTCPSTHPIPIPDLSIALNYKIPTTAGQVSLSSGTASSMHSDFFDAWDPQVLKDLVVGCINKVGPSDPRPDYCSGL